MESTWRWDDGVQETAVYNITGNIGGKGRYWKKHGKLPYITYEAEDTPKVEDKPKSEETAKGDYTLSFRYLRRGCKGEDVKALQTLLIGMGYDCGGYGADGDFGAKTEAAVIAYQKAVFPNDPKQWDGVVGADTMGSLMGV